MLLFKKTLIINQTGCLPPCQYKENNIILLTYIYTSTWPSKTLYLWPQWSFSEKIESYSWISLVPNIVASLGLFLRFSFFMNVSYTHFVIQVQKGLNLSRTLSTLIILDNLNVFSEQNCFYQPVCDPTPLHTASQCMITMLELHCAAVWISINHQRGG